MPVLRQRRFELKTRPLDVSVKEIELVASGVSIVIEMTVVSDHHLGDYQKDLKETKSRHWL